MVMGIGLAYYHTQLSQQNLAEQTYEKIIEMHPDNFDADYKILHVLQEPTKRRSRLKTS